MEIEDYNLKLYLHMEQFHKVCRTLPPSFRAITSQSQGDVEEQLDIINEFLVDEGFIGPENTDENTGLVNKRPLPEQNPCSLLPILNASRVNDPGQGTSQTVKGCWNNASNNSTAVAYHVEDDNNMGTSSDGLTDGCLMTSADFNELQKIVDNAFRGVDLTDIFTYNFETPEVVNPSEINNGITPADTTGSPPSSYGSPPNLSLNGSGEEIYSGTPPEIPPPPTLEATDLSSRAENNHAILSVDSNVSEESNPGPRPSSPYTINKWWEERINERKAKKSRKPKKRNRQSTRRAPNSEETTPTCTAPKSKEGSRRRLSFPRSPPSQTSSTSDNSVGDYFSRLHRQSGNEQGTSAQLAKVENTKELTPRTERRSSMDGGKMGSKSSSPNTFRRHS